MELRVANLNDIPVLVRLRWAFRTENRILPVGGPTWEEFQPTCDAFFRSALQSGRWAFWVAEQEGEIIAQVCIQQIEKIPNPRSLAPKFGYVTNVYTQPAYRNAGIGAQLMARVKQWAAEQGLEMLVLWPSQRAIRFYKRMGFDFSKEAMEWVNE